MSLSPISALIDLSTIHYNNPNLIVKNALEYVERMDSAKRVINGISYSSITNKPPTRVKISLKSSADDKFSDEYESPEIYNQQLTLACFLYAVANLTNLGNRAHIFCTNASGRGDTQQSISTKHSKSKLQERLTDILNDEEFISNLRSEINTELPDTLTDVQKALIEQSTSGKIGGREIKRIKTNFSVDEIDIYLELEALKKNDNLPKSQIPHVEFTSVSISEVVEMLHENKIAISLKRENQELSEHNDKLSDKLTSLNEELEHLKKRNLWQRILNRK